MNERVTNSTMSEMKLQLDIATDLGQKRFEKIAYLEELLRWRPVSEKPKDNQVVESKVIGNLYSITRYCERENAYYEFWRGGSQTVIEWRPVPELEAHGSND